MLRFRDVRKLQFVEFSHRRVQKYIDYLSHTADLPFSKMLDKFYQYRMYIGS